MAKYMKEKKLYNIFLEFYRLLTHKIKDMGIARNVWAVNVDGAIASTVLATCWQALKEKRISMARVCDIAFMVFAVGRTAGAGGEYLDHQDHGSPMDMRTPASEGVALTKAKD
jgi:prolipoprotein diacylglyceryltransferase